MLINPELSFFGLRSHQNLRNLVVSSGMSGLFYVCKWICVYTFTYMPWYHNISQQCEPWKFQSLVKPQLYSRNKIAFHSISICSGQDDFKPCLQFWRPANCGIHGYPSFWDRTIYRPIKHEDYNTPPPIKTNPANPNKSHDPDLCWLGG